MFLDPGADAPGFMLASAPRTRGTQDRQLKSHGEARLKAYSDASKMLLPRKASPWLNSDRSSAVG
jgi:hypothetical protein